MFLYWGAEWCPPCAQIKSTIFNKREFQERSRLFVPVYLDGDTPSAQKHGERFGVVGYPTMILFQPGRHRDHAPAGRRRHRALRDDPRRRARRRAAGDARSSRPRRSGGDVIGERLAAARLLLLGAPTTAACCRHRTRGDVPRLQRPLPARDCTPECARLYLRVPRRRWRRARRMASRRRTASSARTHAASCSACCRSPGRRARPTSTTCCTAPTDVDRRAVRRRHAGARSNSPAPGATRSTARRRTPRPRCRRPEQLNAVRARDAAREARRARRAAAAGAARRSRARPSRRVDAADDRWLRAPGRDQRRRGPVLGGRARRGGQHAAGRGAREVEVALLLHARPRRPRREGGPRGGSAWTWLAPRLRRAQRPGDALPVGLQLPRGPARDDARTTRRRIERAGSRGARRTRRLAGRVLPAHAHAARAAEHEAARMGQGGRSAPRSSRRCAARTAEICEQPAGRTTQAARNCEELPQAAQRQPRQGA
ncbi:MAG: thioredoxin domain-containing protein [Desulfobacterales bacterium]|nr:thioredoxin domain-containing protein [Desulfobacterales bacterium]